MRHHNANLSAAVIEPISENHADLCVGSTITNKSQFIVENTQLLRCPLSPEIELHLASEIVPIWQLTEEQLAENGLPPPFWAFAWAGGQALSRYILDYPEAVLGKRVLDFASGSGIVAIAASKSGAKCVDAADIDPFAAEAIRINAERNRADVTVIDEDLVGGARSNWDVILAGDICYEQPLAGQVEGWLRQQAARGVDVYIGDPGRSYLPKDRMEKLVSYAVKTTRELEDAEIRNTSVWRILPGS
jgi:predicted nicotinamide N-methyase